MENHTFISARLGLKRPNEPERVKVRVWQHAIVARNCARPRGGSNSGGNRGWGRPGRALSPRLVTATMQLLLTEPAAPVRGRLSTCCLLLHSVLLGPLLGRLIVLGAIRLVNARDLRHERVVRIRIGQQRANGEDDLARRERG